MGSLPGIAPHPSTHKRCSLCFHGGNLPKIWVTMRSCKRPSPTQQANKPMPTTRLAWVIWLIMKATRQLQSKMHRDPLAQLDISEESVLHLTRSLIDLQTRVCSNLFPNPQSSNCCQIRTPYKSRPNLCVPQLQAVVSNFSPQMTSKSKLDRLRWICLILRVTWIDASFICRKNCRRRLSAKSRQSRLESSSSHRTCTWNLPRFRSPRLKPAKQTRWNRLIWLKQSSDLKWRRPSTNTSWPRVRSS